jgi:hypothetical protein
METVASADQYHARLIDTGDGGVRLLIGVSFARPAFPSCPNWLPTCDVGPATKPFSCCISLESGDPGTDSPALPHPFVATLRRSRTYIGQIAVPLAAGALRLTPMEVECVRASVQDVLGTLGRGLMKLTGLAVVLKNRSLPASR